MTKNPRSGANPRRAAGRPEDAGRTGTALDRRQGFDVGNFPDQRAADGCIDLTFGIATSSRPRQGAGHRICTHPPHAAGCRMPDTAQLKENFTFVSSQDRGRKDSLGVVRRIRRWPRTREDGFRQRYRRGVTMDEAKLYAPSGSILVECGTLEYPHAELLELHCRRRGADGQRREDARRALQVNTEKFAAVYPDKGLNTATVMTPRNSPIRAVEDIASMR